MLIVLVTVSENNTRIPKTNAIIALRPLFFSPRSLVEESNPKIRQKVRRKGQSKDKPLRTLVSINVAINSLLFFPAAFEKVSNVTEELPFLAFFRRLFGYPPDNDSKNQYYNHKRLGIWVFKPPKPSGP